MSRDKPQTRQRMRTDMGHGNVFDIELSWDEDRRTDPVWIDVVCARVFTHDGTPEGEHYTKRAGTADEDVLTFEEADKLFRVAVKWDGCAHWDLSGYVHTCGGDEPMAVFGAHAAAYEAAKTIMINAGTWIDVVLPRAPAPPSDAPASAEKS